MDVKQTNKTFEFVAVCLNVQHKISFGRLYKSIISKSRTYRKRFHRKEQRAMAEMHTTDASLAADLLHSFFLPI